MSKRTMQFVIVVALLVLLVGAYWIVTSINQKKAAEAAEELAGEEVQTITLIDMSLSDLTSFSLHASGTQMDFSRDEEGNWQYADSRLQIASSSINNIAGYVSYLSARRIITESPADLAEYGLADPQVTATANFSSGETRQVFIGNLSATGDLYYALADNSNTVYAVAKYVGDNFLVTLNDLVVKELVQIDTTQADMMSTFYLKAKDKETMEVVLDYEGDELMEYGMSGYIVMQPYERKYGTSEAFIKTYCDSLLNLTIKDFIAYTENQDELSQYGFDNPSLEIKAVTEPNAETKAVKRLHLIFGDMANDTDIYFKNNGDPVVYTMDKSLVQVYFDYKPFDFINRFLALVNIKKIDSLTIATYGNDPWEFVTTIKHTKNTKEDGTEEEVESFYYKENLIEESAYRTFYQMIIGFLGDTFLEEADVPPAGTQPDITVTYWIPSHNQERVVNLVSINDSFYAGGLNGEYTFAINKRSVDAAVARAKELAEEYQ